MKQEDPLPQFSHIISSLADSFPNLSYIHLVEPRVNGIFDKVCPEGESLDFARQIWKKTGKPLFVAGGYTPENALEHMAVPGHENDVCVFGRWYIANVSLIAIAAPESYGELTFFAYSLISRDGSKRAFR